MSSPQLCLLLVRHGASQANRPDTFLGRSDAPLTAEGRQQAEQAAALLAAEPVAAVYASPLIRAHHTAERIAGGRNLPLFVDKRLVEQDFGRWEGLTFAEAAAQFPADFAAWQADAACCPPTGGETLDAVQARQLNFYQALRRDFAGQTAVIVGHGGALNALLCGLLQTPLRGLWPYRLALGSVTELHLYDQGAVLTLLSKLR
jgi:broad specificity phosphatase PhoE